MLCVHFPVGTFQALVVVGDEWGVKGDSVRACTHGSPSASNLGSHEPAGMLTLCAVIGHWVTPRLCR